VIIVEAPNGSPRWIVTCDEHGVISEHQTTADYALERAMKHIHDYADPTGVCWGGTYCGPVVMLRKVHGNKWSIWRPEQVWKWAPDLELGTRSTRTLIEKRVRA
jgi:hypothetical protein